MVQTTKEALARAEFWAMEAMNHNGITDGQREVLRKANDLIKTANAMEEDKAQKQALMAAQVSF